jgi:hypothetical protein
VGESQLALADHFLDDGEALAAAVRGSTILFGGLVDGGAEVGEVGHVTGEAGGFAAVGLGGGEAAGGEVLAAALDEGFHEAVEELLAAAVGAGIGGLEERGGFVQSAAGQGSLASFQAKDQHD